MYAIETDGLTKLYGSQVVVNNINLKVKAGTIFGFLGKNGAGKTTFINLLTGLSRPTSGGFKLLGQENINGNKIKKKIGVLPDYSEFYDDLTAMEHLKYFSRILGVSLSREEMYEILKSVELEKAAYTKVGKYSFGMKKKLGIAQSLINNPDLIFLDEPTSGVDANAVLTIQSLIRSLAKKGKTIFLTSHNLVEVEKLCDEISIMDKGTIKFQGNMNELRNKYQNKLTVYIKHGSITKDKKVHLEETFIKTGSQIEWGNNLTKLIVDDELILTNINKSFFKSDIDIFRIEVEEPSLEEIFLKIV